MLNVACMFKAFRELCPRAAEIETFSVAIFTICSGQWTVGESKR